MHEYRIKIRRYRRGAHGSTQYRFPVKVQACAFADGYRAALCDVGMNSIYVSVHDENGVKLYETK